MIDNFEYVPGPRNIVEVAERILQKFRHLNPLWNPGYFKANYPVFSHPVDMKKAWISQYFGDNPQNYKPLNGHDGLDYALVTGSGCMCPVEWLKITDLLLKTTGYGRQAWAIDESGHRYIFGHLSEFLCEVGQEVTRGMVFAKTGGGLDDPYRGYSTGPHLHWEWRPVWASINNGYAGAVDQFPYITFGEVTPTPLPVPEPLFWMVVQTDGLRSRTSGKIPWFNNLTGKKYAKGSRIPVYESDILDGRLFAKISANNKEYLCYKENETNHMTKE